MRFLLVPEVQRMIGLSRMTIYRLERAGRFPRRRGISTRRVGWFEQEIEEWMKTRDATLSTISKSEG